MTDQLETASEATKALESWGKKAETVVEPYHYYQNGVPTHVVEILTHKCHQGWEYDVSVRKINEVLQGGSVIDQFETQETLMELRCGMEDTANEVAARAMQYLEEHGEFDADIFKPFPDSEVAA